MLYTKLTKKAMRFACQAHEGQVDRGGLPYILHPIHLAEQMPDEYSTAAALLHDVLEDAAVTEEQLRAEGFPEPILHALGLLTHDPSVDYMDYIRALKDDPIAAAVKLADLKHNSDLSRLDTVSAADFERVEKYRQAEAVLTARRTVEVVAALIERDGRFLICQRPTSKARPLLWEFVGGKVEAGETREAALCRECREELGVELAVHALYMDVLHEYPDLTVHLSLYRAAIQAGEPLLLEHAALAWITPAEIPLYDFCPADEDILKRLQA